MTVEPDSLSVTINFIAPKISNTIKADYQPVLTGRCVNLSALSSPLDDYNYALAL